MYSIFGRRSKPCLQSPSFLSECVDLVIGSRMRINKLLLVRNDSSDRCRRDCASGGMPMTRIVRFIVLLMFVSLVSSAPRLAAQGKGDVELRAAMETETVKGDLKGAIEQYRKVAAEARDRAVAAMALVRMADCYQRLGDAQARVIYERV